MAKLGAVRIVTIPGCIPSLEITPWDDVTVYVPWDCSDERRAELETLLKPELQAEERRLDTVRAMAAAMARSAEETRIRLALECFNE